MKEYYITLTFPEYGLDYLIGVWDEFDKPAPDYKGMLKILEKDSNLLGMCIQFGCSDTEVRKEVYKMIAEGKL